MNTIENKKIFFAQYWGQEIGQKEGDVMGIDYEINSSNMRTMTKDEYLELKPLSSISDEDAIEVSKILIDKNIKTFEKSYFDSYRFCKTFKFGKFLLQFDDIGDRDYRVTIDKEKSIVSCFHNIVNSCDYLRSKGYALPWNGITVDEMIKYGWITLLKASEENKAKAETNQIETE